MSGKLNSGMVAIRSNSRKIPLSTAIEKGVKSNGSPRRAKAKRRSKDDRREDPSSLVSGPKIGKGPRKSPVPAGMKIRDESENAKDVLRREEKVKIGKASDSTAKSKEAVKPYEAKRDCSHAQVKEDVGEDRSEDYGSISREDTTRTFTPPSGKLKRRASNQSLQDSEEYHSERIVKRMSNSIKNQDGMRSSRSSSASDRTEDGHDGARQDDSEVHSEEELVNSDVESHLGHLHHLRKVILERNLIPSVMLARMPSAHQKLAREHMTVENARRINRWFSVTFRTSETSMKYRPDLCRFDAAARYSEMVAKKMFERDADRAALLFALFVSMGCTARICVNTLPTPRTWNERIANEVAKMRNSSASTFSTKHWKRGRRRRAGFKKKSTRANEYHGMARDYWVEYWDEKQNRWICVDPRSGTVDDPNIIEDYITKPVLHIFAIDIEGDVHEVTARYMSDFWRADLRRRRSESKCVKKNNMQTSRYLSEQENLELHEGLVKKSLPTTMAEFKNHPLYVLEKDLLKFEGIYLRPEDQKPLGEVCGHKVYSRSTVYILQSANNWIKMARNIKEGEKPYKVVKARPNIRVPAEERVQRHLDLFGYWQTEPYRPPKVINGRIPRNEFGNVYMYQPSMCPIGAVHLRLPGLPSIARRLGGLECVPAIVGWDFRSRSNFPIIDGVCVLEEVAEKFISEYRGLEEMRMERENKEREDRALGNWRRLARGVLRYLYTKSKFGAA